MQLFSFCSFTVLYYSSELLFIPDSFYTMSFDDVLFSVLPFFLEFGQRNLNKSLHIEDGKAPTTCILSKTSLRLSVEFIPLSKTIVISSRGISISSTRLQMLSIKPENRVASGMFAGYVIVWKGMFLFEVVKPTPMRFLSYRLSLEKPFFGRSSPCSM